MTKELHFDIIFDHQKLVYLLLKQIKVETTTSKSEVLNTTATTFIPTTKQENTTNSTTTVVTSRTRITTSEAPKRGYSPPGKPVQVVIVCASLAAFVGIIYLGKYFKKNGCIGYNSGSSALF